jgi:hypothetical protein
MTVRTTAERLPLIPPHPLPQSLRASPASSHLPDFEDLRLEVLHASHTDPAASQTNLPSSNFIGNELRRQLLSGDMNGESSGIRRFRFLKATDNPC